MEDVRIIVTDGLLTESEDFNCRKTVCGCNEDDFKNEALPAPEESPGVSIAAFRAFRAFKDSIIASIFGNHTVKFYPAAVRLWNNQVSRKRSTFLQQEIHLKRSAASCSGLIH